MSTLKRNLQLVINAQAAVQAAMKEPKDTGKERLQEAADALEDLFDNLEADLLKWVLLCRACHW